MRVLLVEDEPHLGSAVQEHVRAAGHAVDWFERLEPAEHAVLTVSYDALLLDLHLPDGRGLDFLRRLRRRGDALPVVILTARDRRAPMRANIHGGTRRSRGSGPTDSQRTWNGAEPYRRDRACRMQCHFLAQPTLMANAIAVTAKEHPDHPLGIGGGPANVAVKRL